MKKTITKLLILILVAMVLVNFGVMCNTSFANIEAEGVINVAANLIGGVISIVFYLKKLMVVIAAFCVNIITAFIGKMDGVINNGDSGFLLLTPFQLFFNKLQITDVNFFDLSVGADTVSYKIRTTVSSWFYVMRLISSAVLLLILIYIGIRMAISTVAEDKARYKKMLFDWGASLALVFVLQYIIIFTVYANTAIINALEKVATNTDISEAINNIALTAAVGIGINSITSAVVYCMLALQVLGLLIAYINRMLKVAFLIIISPLISITYSIDKMGDNKSQALDTWLKEYVYTILIQPFHCIMYIGLIGVAFNLIVNDSSNPLEMIGNALGPEYNQLANGILAILCVKFIKDAEEIVRKIFGFKDDNSTTSMAAGMALTMVAASKAQNLGKSARSLGTKASKFAGGFGKAVGSDAKRIGNYFKNKGGKIGKVANAVGNGASKAGNIAKATSTKIGNAKKSFGGSKFAKKISGAAGKVKGGIGRLTAPKSRLGKFIMKRNSPASAFGIALGAMAYGSGTTSALQAIGMGHAGKQGAQAFMDTSTKRMVGEDIDLQDKAEKEQKSAAENNNELIKDKEKATADLKSASNDLEAAYGMDTDESLDEKIESAKEEVAEAEEEREQLGEPPDPSDKKNTDEYNKKVKNADAKVAEKKNNLDTLKDKKEKISELKGKKEKAELNKKELDSILDSTSDFHENLLGLDEILIHLRAALTNMGQEDKMDTLVHKITIEVSLDPKGFDLGKVLDNTLDDKPDEIDDETSEEYDAKRRIVFARAAQLEINSLNSMRNQIKQMAYSVGIDDGTFEEKKIKEKQRRSENK